MGYFDGLDMGAAFKGLQPPEPKGPGLIGSSVDTSLSVARGAVQGTKMLSDAFGAGNAVSNTLQRGIDWLSSNFSDHSQWEQLTSAQDQRAAALSGSTWEEVKAAARSFAKRPVDFLAEAAGTSLPTIAAAFLPGGQGAVLGRVAMMSVGAAQGAGSVKGQIFQTVEEAWKQAGVAPEEARERAAAAQEYFGSNGGQVALGAALGAVAGGTGVEAGVLGARAGAGAAAEAASTSIFARAAARTPQFVKDGLKEALPEAAQGGQEQLAGNLAMQNEGFATPTMQGVAGNAVLEGLAGGAFGAAASPLHRAHQPSTSDQGLRELASAATADEAINAAMKAADVPLTGGLTADAEARALTTLDAQADADLKDIRNAGRAMTLEQQRASGAPPAPAPEPMAEPVVTDAPFADRVLTLREQVQDAGVREQVRAAFGPDALREVMRAASVADRPDINLPEVTRERILAAAETIVSRAVAQPIAAAAPAPSATRVPAGPALEQPASVPRIALDTEPTGTIRVNRMGSAAPEVRADVISTKQRVDEMRRRPDGMTQQVDRRPLPRDFTLVGEGTLETPSRPAPAAPRQIAMDTALDERAHAAATSPTNDRPEPTEAQQRAGNYAKGHIRVGGLDISVENPAGSTRRGVDEDGKPWENQLAHHYGYIRRTTGADGDHVDVFVKPGTPDDYAGPVYIVDQVDPRTGKFDEHKVVLGAKDRADAEATYRANYATDWQGLKAIKAMTMPAFKKWLAGETTKPAASLKDRVDAMRKPAPAASTVPFQMERRQDGFLRHKFKTNEGMDGHVSIAPPGWRKGVNSYEVMLDRTGGPKSEDGKTKFYPTVTVGKYRSEDAALKAAAQVVTEHRAPAQAADPNALPTAKLAELVDLTGRGRDQVAKQYLGLVKQYGREKADQMLEKALATARAKPTPAPAPAPAANEGAAAQPTASAPSEQPAPPTSSPPAAAPAPQPQPEPEGEAAAATEAAAPAPRKEPWEMSQAEWESAREATRPDVAQSNFTRASGSQATAKLREVERLTFGVSEQASERLRAAAKNGERIPTEELDALMERVNTRVSHRDVVEKALREGKPVPDAVAREYPDIESTAAPAAPQTSAADNRSADEVADEKSGAERVALPGDRPAEPAKRKTTLAAEVARRGQQRQRLNALQALRNCLHG